MILVVAGSEREGGPSQAVARLAVSQLRASGEAALLLDLCEPEDGEAMLFRARGVVFVVEERTGGYPSELKGFLDRLIRPDLLAHLPCAFIGLSDGPWGGLRAVEQLELNVHHLGAHLFGSRLFMRHIGDVLDENGEMTSDSRAARLRKLLVSFADFADALSLPVDPTTEEVLPTELAAMMSGPEAIAK